jgi:hypothetical protein
MITQLAQFTRLFELQCLLTQALAKFTSDRDAAEHIKTHFDTMVSTCMDRLAVPCLHSTHPAVGGSI